MTRLERSLYRVVEIPGGRFRPVTVGLHPGGRLSFREFGCRKEVSIPVLACFELASKAAAAAEKRARDVDRVAARAAGRRRR